MGEKRSSGGSRATKGAGQKTNVAGPKAGAAGKPTGAAGSENEAAGKSTRAAGKPAQAAGKPMQAADRPTRSAGPLSKAADNEVTQALAQADLSLESQLRVYRALRGALDAYTREGASELQRSVLQDALRTRGRILKDVARATLRRAHAAFARSRKAAQQKELEQAFMAAQTVWTTVDPEAAQHASIADILGTSGEAMVRPFFARFLEGQNRGQAAVGSGKAAPRKGIPIPGDIGAVTLKFPSDQEDGGGGGGGPVTLKFPSDQEDGGGGGGGPAPVTLKYPSDEEDAGSGTCGSSGSVTLKYPSDEEDGGQGDASAKSKGGGPTQLTTLKYPSDQEDSGSLDAMTTCKFPSDDEGGNTSG